jgi:hypothetical protein
MVQLEKALADAGKQQAVERVRRLGLEYCQVREDLDALLGDWSEVAG